MILKVVIEDQIYPITVPEQIISEAGEFFDRIDKINEIFHILCYPSFAKVIKLVSNPSLQTSN